MQYSQTVPAAPTPAPAAHLAYYAFALVAFSAGALANGYPLIFYDTGTYLRTGIELRFPTDRPVFYGLFLLPLHLRLSLWPIVAAQALLVAFLLDRVLARWLPPAHAASSRLRLALVALLAAGTSLPWFAGQVMPDLFAPLVVLAVLLVASEPPRLASPAWWLAAGILVLCQVVHVTHVPLALAVILTLAAGRLLLRAPVPWPGLAIALAAVAASYGLLVAANLVGTGRATTSYDGGLFLLARLLDYGTAQDYLARTCPPGMERVCATLKDFPAGTKDYFLWVYLQEGHLGGFAGLRDDAARLSRLVVLDAPLRHARLALEAGLAQFLHFPTATSLDVLRPGTSAAQIIHARFGWEAAQFDASLQQRGALPLYWLNLVHRPLGFAMLALGAVALALAAWRRNAMAATVLLATFAGLAANALLGGGLSMGDARYQSRMMMLLPIALAIALAHLRNPADPGNSPAPESAARPQHRNR